MEENTDSTPIRVEMNNPLVLQVSEEGSYVIFPEGAKVFADRYGGELLMVEPDGDIQVLRRGLQKNKLMWVSVVIDQPTE